MPPSSVPLHLQVVSVEGISLSVNVSWTAPSPATWGNAMIAYTVSYAAANNQSQADPFKQLLGSVNTTATNSTGVLFIEIQLPQADLIYVLSVTGFGKIGSGPSASSLFRSDQAGLQSNLVGQH